MVANSVETCYNQENESEFKGGQLNGKFED